MEYIRELLVIDDTEPVVGDVPRKKKKFSPRIAAAVIALAVVGAVAWSVTPMDRYGRADRLMERGEYAKAYECFAELGDYKDAQAMVGEAGKGIVYLDAQALAEQAKYREALERYESIGDFADTQEKIREAKYLLALTLLEQGEEKEARELLAQAGDYADAAEILQEMVNEEQYKWAEANMVTEKYAAAAEEFQKLGDYRDAAEKAAECRRLAEVKAAYEDGMWRYRDGKWLAAYRILSEIRDEDYRDTEKVLDEITAVAPERTRYYAEKRDRGKMLAFLQLTEESDPEAGAALRQELVQKETFRKDQSYFMFDLKEPTYCSTSTTPDEFVAAILYMITYSKTELTLMSYSDLDKATTLGHFYKAENMLSEVVPGYGSLYEVSIAFWGNGVQIDLDYEQGYSEHQRSVHLKTYKDFCENSLRDLVEAGLISSSMTYRERAEIISEWIGFYLTYDKSLVIHDAGVAVDEAKGVCESYATLYHRMCNLAGIPTYGQVGNAGERHIWLVHVDEEGNIFYADPTWADSWDIDFSGEQERPTVADFVEKYLERCLLGGVAEYKYPTYTDGTGQVSRWYLWAGKLWSTHTPDRSAEEIIAVHNKLLGKTA